MSAQNNDVPIGKLARVGVFGKTAAKFALNEIGFKAKRPFMSEENRRAADIAHDEENAKLLFQALSQLRGTATKLGQFFAMELDILPKAYSDELAKSFYKIPPLNKTLVRKIIINELGAPPEEVFAQFDANAFASASLGQVHRAILHDGQKVAVKIQYPGIHEATKNDLQILRQFSSSLPNQKLILESAKEIESRILEETDYLKEAENIKFFADFCQSKNIIIPKVHDGFSTKKIIVTDYVEGMHLDDFLANRLSQKALNKAAQTLYDFFVDSFRNLKALHADPNPGNYIFCENGDLAIIDFGCVKKFELNFVEILPRIFNAHLNSDKEKIINCYGELGIAKHKIDDETYENFLKPFGQWSITPLRNESFNFGFNGHSINGKEFMKQLPKMELFANNANDFVFFNRTIYGLCKIFEKMKAEIKIQSRWKLGNEI